MNILYVAIGGFFGAITRYFIANKLAPLKSRMPIATFLVNLSGSFLLGLIAGIMPPSKLSLLFGIGFLGSYTTFSTFKVEIIRLLQDEKWKLALTYLLLSYFGGILLAYMGFVIGHQL